MLFEIGLNLFKTVFVILKQIQQQRPSYYPKPLRLPFAQHCFHCRKVQGEGFTHDILIRCLVAFPYFHRILIVWRTE